MEKFDLNEKTETTASDSSMPPVSEGDTNLRKIIIASNAVRFLTEYIHGIAAGRSDLKNRVSLSDANYHIEKLKRIEKFEY